MAFACCVMSCVSKPTAICFPALAFLIDLVIDRRWRTRALAYLPFLVVSVTVGAITMYAQSHPIGSAELNVFEESLSWRLLNAFVALGMYVYHTFVLGSVYFDYRAVFGGEPLDMVLGLSVFLIRLIILVIFGFYWLFLVGLSH